MSLSSGQDDARHACVSVKVSRQFMNEAPDDTEQIRDALAELDLGARSSFIPSPLPVVTHTAEAAAQPRPNRLGLETLTHAPLNFRVFPETPYSMDEFQMQTGKRSSLGKGAMGNVHLVRWMTHPDKPLRALKRISKFQMWKDDNPIVLFEQLWDEIEALMTLKHQHIVGLDGYFEDYKYVYLIMEYAPNGDLNQLLDNQKRLSELEVARHIRSLVEALLFCHEHSYLHRDIKPENLLISSKGDLLLADFGCVATRHSTRKSLCGTRYYHSFEMANEEPHDAASDAWSVGVVTFELLHGKSPFESDDDSESEDDDLDDGTQSEDEYESDSEAQSRLESDENDLEEVNRESDQVTTESDSETLDGNDETDRDDDDLSETDQVEISNHSDSDSDLGEQEFGSSNDPSVSREDALEIGNNTKPQHIRYDEHGNVIRNEGHAGDESPSQPDSEDDGNSNASSNHDSNSTNSEDSGHVEKIYNRIRNLEYRFPDFFSENAKDFITRLLQKDKERRMSLSEALNHPFITQLNRLNSVPN